MSCSNTNVWLDGNFIAGFTTLLYHYAHSSGTPLVRNEKNLPQLIYAIFSKQKLVISDISLFQTMLIGWLLSFTMMVTTLCWRLTFLRESSWFMMVSHVNFFNGRTTSSSFSRSVCCWICPLTPHQQCVFQMLQFHQFFHAAGNLGISSMVIQLFFLSLHPQTKKWNSGD